MWCYVIVFSHWVTTSLRLIGKRSTSNSTLINQIFFFVDLWFSSRSPFWYLDQILWHCEPLRLSKWLNDVLQSLERIFIARTIPHSMEQVQKLLLRSDQLPFGSFFQLPRRSTISFDLKRKIMNLIISYCNKSQLYRFILRNDWKLKFQKGCLRTSLLSWM